jgi:hypothetical protein
MQSRTLNRLFVSIVRATVAGAVVVAALMVMFAGDGLRGQVIAQKTAAPVTLKAKYPNLEVDQFAIQEGIDIPAEYIPRLQDEVFKEIKKSETFLQVNLFGQEPSESEARVLRLTGTVTYFDPGTRGKRYVGFGMGAGQMVVRVAFCDRATGKTLAEEETTATLAGGLFGGNADGIIREFAKRLATATKLLMEKSVPTHDESPSAKPAKPAAASPELKVVMKSNSIDRAEEELNATAAKGYWLTEFSAKGPQSAEATMQATDTPQSAYQYRVVHILWLGNLQKGMNKWASEGYRYVPHSLVQLKGAVAVAIMEKPPTQDRKSYVYRVHGAVKVDNAKKDIAKDQAENFVLAGILDTSGIHIALMEKVTPATEK